MKDLLAFLVLLLNTEKAQGGVDGALAFIKEFSQKVIAGLPDGARDYATPLAAALQDLLGENADKFDLQAIAQAILVAVQAGLGDTDTKAGGGM